MAANIVRTLWTYAVIVYCHFAEGAEKFTADGIEGETRSERYLLQMLGTANITVGPALAFATGNLCHQIEHHLFPDLPSNRHHEIARRVRALCANTTCPYYLPAAARSGWNRSADRRNVVGNQ